ncbi:hypothetical protein [Pseudonocardia oroxyli]|uniref:HTH araC/xylS-type domain-containing protein n=1 Tax=Pseudonocardia oroxyli TaxID=366584 RepID=A0A1G8AHK8_PSEOR|nr:hypothetical protein [Pseudonocardia oroxyli]SDH20377.1 hypothetical protein SAMN05216377_12045 [Pseudonocardia oroxyli]
MKVPSATATIERATTAKDRVTNEGQSFGIRAAVAAVASVRAAAWRPASARRTGRRSTTVAHCCGWSSASVFIDAFRRTFGRTPGRHPLRSARP